MGETAAGIERHMSLPDGDSLLLRLETDADAAFLKDLFLTTTLRQMGLTDPTGMEPLLEMQHVSRERTYAVLWPDARRWVIEHDGSPVGGLIEGDAAGALHVIDISLAPQVQGHGLGSAVIADLQDRAAARGLGVTAHIMLGNVASLALFRARGFTGSARDGEAQIAVRWTP